VVLLAVVVVAASPVLGERRIDKQRPGHGVA
jgi:hypothetical protein